MRNQIVSSEMQMREDLTYYMSLPRGGTPVNERNSWTRRSRLGLVGSLAGWLGVAAAILLGHAEARAQVISRVSAPGKFYVDDKASIGLLYNYAAYVISNNTAATFASVYVAITNIVGTNLIQIGN